MSLEVTKYNSKQIVSLKIRDKRINPEWTWWEAPTNWWIRLLYKVWNLTSVPKSGFEYIFQSLLNTPPQTAEQLKVDYIVIDKTVYHKPSVEIQFTNKHTFTKEFDTVEEARDWCFSHVPNYNISNLWINIK